MQKQPSASTYTGRQVFTTDLAGQSVQFISKPGIPNWNLVTASMALIAGLFPNLSDERILYLGCSHGAGAVAIAQGSPQCEIWCHDDNAIAIEMTNNTFRANRLTNVKTFSEINLFEQEKQKFNCAIIDMPKGRRLTQRWLLQAWEAVTPGGTLYLAGSNDHGIRTTIKDAQQLWGLPAILGYKKGCRLARFRKASIPEQLPDWVELPGIMPNTWHDLEVAVGDIPLKLASLPGIFSYDRLDTGTGVLLDSIEVSAGSNVLDLGCGYGIIGIVAKLRGAARVDFVDTSLLAITATQENTRRHRLRETQVFAGDIFEAVPDCCYDLILTNPPFHSGKRVDYQMAEAFIQQSNRHLTPEGQFILVANQFIHYDALMKQFFKHVTTVQNHSGFQVFAGTNK